jgi:hypothetical protein
MEEKTNARFDDDEMTIAGSTADSSNDIFCKKLEQSLDTATRGSWLYPFPSPPAGVCPEYFQQDQLLALKIQIRSTMWANERRLRKRGALSTALASASWALTGSFTSAKWKIGDLCFACGALDIDKVIRLVDEGTPVDADYSVGRTPLLSVVRATPYRPAAQRAMIQFLIDLGVDINTGGKYKVSPLCVAVELDRVELVKFLLDAGAELDAADSWVNIRHRYSGYKLSAVEVAAGLRRTECLEVLLSRGATPGVGGGFGIMHSLRSCAPEVQATQAFAASRTGVTALHMADGKCAALLLAHGADLAARDSSGRTALHWAVEEGDFDAVELYLSKGYAVDQTDRDGASALALVCARLEMGASRDGFPRIVGCLLERGADLDVHYPGKLTIWQRWLLMEEWRAVYAPIFEEFPPVKKGGHS